jgi:hypothetical protein
VERKARDTRERRSLLLNGHLLVNKALHLIFDLALFLLLALLATATTIPCSLGDSSGLSNVVFILKEIGISGSGTGPEAGETVVGSRGKNMTQGMPVQGPDGEIVSI